MGTLLASLPAAIWGWLLLAHGRFWLSGPELLCGESSRGQQPPVPLTEVRVIAVIPARDEAEAIAASLSSLLAQEFGGTLGLVLVDDNSNDGTGALASSLARDDARLRVVQGQPLPHGWSGKMWAVAQGLEQTEACEADFVLLTDADIVHGPGHVETLVRHALTAPEGPLDLVSEMVSLRTESLAERALIPAFVFFFQLLYPFRRVNDPQRREAAAAGGTMLVSRAALDRIGGVSRLRDRLIDDVALAKEVKRGGRAIWLGHAREAASLRRYPAAQDVFDMVARTAYVQLNHSPGLLAGTVAGMGLLYVQPVVLALFGRGRARVCGIAAWSMMAVAFQPTLRRYRRSPLWGLALPGIALFYTAATVASALRHKAGKGGQWKGRAYS